jgi:drug/metabolite transporter (DMT)-like permease
MNPESVGEILLFFEMLTWGLAAVLIRFSDGVLPPIFFAGAAQFLAGILFLPILFFLKLHHDFRKKEYFSPAAKSTFFIISGFLIWFVAGQKIPAGDFAILNQSEVFFTFAIFGFLGLEKISQQRIFGAGLILIGTILVLTKHFSGNFSSFFLLALLANSIFPIGNFFQKKVLKIVRPKAHLIFRSFVGGGALILVSFFFENWTGIFSAQNFGLILLAAVLPFGVSKILFLEALRRLDVSKVFAIGAAQPIFTIFFAVLFLGEKIDFWQICGGVFAIGGILILTKKEKEKFRAI